MAPKRLADMKLRYAEIRERPSPCCSPPSSDDEGGNDEAAVEEIRDNSGMVAVASEEI